MPPISPETLWHISKQDLLRILERRILAQEPRSIHFYAPGFIHYKTRYYNASPSLFPTVSVTGGGCALNCKHCGGKILQTMHPASTPETLFQVATKLKQDGAAGCLISGGCMPDGSVPLRYFIPTIAAIKRKLGLTVFVHTGIIDASTALALKTAGVDAALIDIIGSDETIKKICNLNVSAQDYASSLLALHEAGLNFVPHVIVGLDDGKLKGEYNALNLIAAVKPSAIVIIAFMPIPGTSMAETNPPAPIDIARVVATARVMFPETPLVLGCMRPKVKNRAETDVLALKAGVDAMAFPSEEAVEYAEAQGYVVSFSSYCCAQIYMDAASRSISK
ncbi:MAG: radical SAM protein [Candidatus Bathyarchaeota archaeon]|nr:radical SAM protein [Candidatus Bathyarchaeota archaeon]